MSRPIRILLKIVLPLTAAYLVIHFESRLTDLARARPGVLPVAMFALVGGLLLPRVRQGLIIALCFGIALLALRDVFGPVRIPPALDYQFGSILEVLYPCIWGLLSALAAVAGAVEALRPGSIAARRCYFGAASVYLIGHGLNGYLIYRNAESLILLATGVVSGAGVFLAHRIVATEAAVEPEDEDIRAQAERTARRAAIVAAREWQESAEERGERRPEELSKAG